MANVVGGTGFQPVGSITGGPYNGSSIRVFFAGTTVTTHLFVGDVVEYDGNGTVDGYPEVVLAAATDKPWGVIVGVEPTAADLSKQYIAGRAGGGYARMVPTEGNFFKIRLSDDDAAIGRDAVGQTTIYVVNAGSTVTGYSGYTASATDAGTSVADELRIMAYVDRPDNDISLETAEVIVMWNENQVALGNAGI